ncbi:MAG TPA: flagellar basal body P-ring formation chaperone FlgA [Candidatus Methylacidiphilales bacterium]
MKTLLLLLLGIGGCLLPLQLRAVVLELRDQQTVAGGNLTLNDLVQASQGVSADDLSAVLAETPSLGKSETWTRARIAAVLPASIKQQQLEWAGASACIVKRPAVEYSEREVRQLITAELARHLPVDSDFAILETPGVDPFLIPDGPLDMRVELSANALRSEWGDATLEFRSQGQLAVTKSVRFHWAYSRLVWQASNRVTGGNPLQASDFQEVEVNVLKLPGLLQPATDFPDGKVAAHALSTGKILMENDWVEPVLVTRNDLVTILYDHHGISITVQARAMANGVRNQVIAVQNLSSHKIFNARVVDQRSLVYDE